MTSRLKIFFLCIIHFIVLSTSAQSSFVRVLNHQMLLNNKPYYYIGTNYWYGGFLGLKKNDAHGIARLRKELDFLNQHGVKNLRVLAGAEGSGQINGVTRVGPALQTAQGKFNEEVLYGLDILLNEMSKRNMKAVLYLSNNWEWSGGWLQYLNWNGLIPDSTVKRKLNWNEQRDYTSKFYTCDPCKAAYLKQLSLIINHVNPISGKKYTNATVIMAWELANEPRPMRPAVNDAYAEWIRNVAAYIKSIDKNHLVTLGHEGEMGTENMALYEKIHSDKNVDYLTIHIWPKNWSWFSDTSIAAGMHSVLTKTNDYISKHLAAANKLNKPIVIEEFGLPRNNHQYSLNASTSLRDQYYQSVFSVLDQQRKINGPLAGVAFWAFGGTARPHNGQTFWKEGDDYMGDPPMEEQGLNTVFDADVSTWRIIQSFTKKINGK